MENVKLYSSLSTTSRMTAVFASYAMVVGECIKHRPPIGFDIDELKELQNELWIIADGYGDTGGGSPSSEPVLGEDEY